MVDIDILHAINAPTTMTTLVVKTQLYCNSFEQNEMDLAFALNATAANFFYLGNYLT